MHYEDGLAETVNSRNQDSLANPLGDIASFGPFGSTSGMAVLARTRTGSGTARLHHYYLRHDEVHLGVVQITTSVVLKGALVAIVAWVANAVVAEIAAVVVAGWSGWAGAGARFVPMDGQL